MAPMSIPAGYGEVDVGKGFSSTLGGLFVDRERRRIAFRVGPNQCNPVDTLHGGAIAVFADAQIIAINHASELRLEHHPTVSLTIDYLAPGRVGDWVEAAVTLDRVTGTLFFTRALICVGETVIARASAIYRNTRERTDGKPATI